MSPPLTAPPPDQFLSVKEAAELLQVHPHTVRYWADDGALACNRTPGGHRRFRRADVEALRDRTA